jgi:hypothetical protein
LVLASALILAVLTAAIAVVSPESQAPFRLHVSTEFAGWHAAADAHLSFDAAAWTASPSNGEGWQGTQDEKSGTVRVGGDRIDLWLKAGDDVLIRREGGDPVTYAIVLPCRAADARLQRGPRSIWRTSAGNATSTAASGVQSLQLQVGGGQSPALRIAPAAGRSQLAERLLVSRLGFATVATHGLEAGLISGGLQFLDKPEAELQLYRGTDLRLGELDAEVASIQMTVDGLDVTASGRAAAADLVVRRSSGTDRRSVMPSRYDWLKGQPVLAVLVGFAAFAGTVGGVVLSLVQTFPALASRLAQWARQ